jgi:hypothetical protein
MKDKPFSLIHLAFILVLSLAAFGCGNVAAKDAQAPKVAASEEKTDKKLEASKDAAAARNDKKPASKNDSRAKVAADTDQKRQASKKTITSKATAEKATAQKGNPAITLRRPERLPGPLRRDIERPTQAARPGGCPEGPPCPKPAK